MLNKLRKTTTSGFQKTVNKKNRHHPLQVSEPITENREYPEGGVAGGPHLPLDDGQAGSGTVSSVVYNWLVIFKGGYERGQKRKCTRMSHHDTNHEKSTGTVSTTYSVAILSKSILVNELFAN
jgi:hypothetical protein